MQLSDSSFFNLPDMMAAAVLLYGIWTGYRSGILLVLINTVALLLAVVMGFLLLDEARELFISFGMKDSVFLPFLVFISVFAGFFFGLRWFGKLVSSAVKKSLFGTIDRTAGALLGLFRMAFLIGSVLYGLSIIGLNPEKLTTQKLWLIPALKATGPAVTSLLAPLLPFLREILEKKPLL